MSSPFPQDVRNIWAVGRNYSEHAKELGNAIPERPMIFLKAGSTVVACQGALVTTQQGAVIHGSSPRTTVKLPAFSSSVHHELEFALRVGYDGRISHYTLALDLTARDVQSEAKAKGEPWTLAKSFKMSTPVGDLLPFTGWERFSNLGLRLAVNGEQRQLGWTREMIFDGPTLLQYIQNHFPVVPGDLILTGTPAGVGPITPGDALTGEILVQKTEISGASNAKATAVKSFTWFFES